MKYFLDTEFIEYPNTIDLISIGIYCEDGREFYAESNEFDATKADDWVKENVIKKLLFKPPLEGEDDEYTRSRQFDDIPLTQSSHVKMRGSKEEITYNILEWLSERDEPDDDKQFEFYGYYSDYDWVVFCWLFGKMIDLPEGFPLYCHDLKQDMDQIGFPENLKPKQSNEHNALSDAKWNYRLYVKMLGYVNDAWMLGYVNDA